MGKRTIILGASNNPSRYSYLAAHQLKHHKHEIIPVGLKKGTVAGEPIRDIRSQPATGPADTITLYMNPANQKPYYEYILTIQPKRIIFNPGTENEELAALARNEHIETVFNCTLRMLGNGSF